jgi:hypothetical protein
MSALQPAGRPKGVNLASLSSEHLYAFSENDLALIASWRFSHVRVCVALPLLDDPLCWMTLDRLLAAGARYGLGCVLALAVPGGALAHRALFADEGAWGRLLQRWEAIARRYLDRPSDFAQGRPGSLAYDLLDRPSPPDDLPEVALQALGAPRLSFAAARRLAAGAGTGRAPDAPRGATGARAWNALAVRLTQAIRAIDRQHPIVVETAGADPAAFAQLRPTGDQHTIYSCHFFEPAAFTRQGAPATAAPGELRRPGSREQARLLPPGARAVSYPGVIDGERWDRERLHRALQPALTFQRTYQTPLYLGAFGVSAAAPHQAQLTWVRSLLSLCHAYGIGWAYGGYRLTPACPFGLIGDAPPFTSLPQFQNPQRLDYDLLAILQSE